MGYVAINNAKSTLPSAINDTVTSIPVQAGHGSRFVLGAGEYTYLALENAAGAIEIVKQTARTGDSLTVVRGQDGTTALAWNIGDIVECRPCVAAMNAKENVGQFASGSTTITIASAGVQPADVVIAHGLGTDNIDFDFTYSHSAAGGDIPTSIMSRNAGGFIKFCGGNTYVSSLTEPALPSAGNIGFVAKSGFTGTITINWWARKRA